jgi:hypothetical protein
VRRPPWFHLTRDDVGEAFRKWLGGPQRDIEVDFFPGKGFLVLMPSPSHHDSILLANNGIFIEQAKLQLLPWTRMNGAESIELPFKIHLCIEGIPHHACQASTVRQLLPPSTLFESINLHYRNNIDAQCCCIVVWTRDPITIAKEAGLWLEEI